MEEAHYGDKKHQRVDGLRVCAPFPQPEYSAGYKSAQTDEDYKKEENQFVVITISLRGKNACIYAI